MFIWAFRSRKNKIYKTFFSFIYGIVIFNLLGGGALAQNLPILSSPSILSPAFTPALVRGIKIYPDNPLKFDFIVDPGDKPLAKEALSQETLKLVKYFLVSLTVPEDDLWVNLSPQEADRIIPQSLSQTELGRDLLAQDYHLKQLTASLLNPDGELGKKFWARVRKEAKEKFGTDDIKTETLNKVWIIPDKAEVFVRDNSVFVVNSHLKVMLEEDYLSSRQTTDHSPLVRGPSTVDGGQISNIIKQIIVPAIEKEVNEGKNFALLRQIQNSAILAAWYKKNLKQSLLGKVYVDQRKVSGINSESKDATQRIYNQYLEAFKKGAYNFIKEDYDPQTQQVTPRKYFSGGVQEVLTPLIAETVSPDFAALSDRTVFPVSLELKGVDSLGQITKQPDAAMTAAVSQEELMDIGRKIFSSAENGRDVWAWLERHTEKYGSTADLKLAVSRMIDDKEFLDILDAKEREQSLEIIRYAVRKNIYLGTKSYWLFLLALNNALKKRDKNTVNLVDLPLKDYVNLIISLNYPEVKQYLESEEFKELDKEDRLVELVNKILELKLPLESKNLGHIYTALPGHLTNGVSKRDIQFVNLPLRVFKQVREALKDQRIEAYIKSKEITKLKSEEAIKELIKYIRSLGYALETKNSAQFVSALPKWAKLKYLRREVNGDAAMIVDVKSLQGVLSKINIYQFAENKGWRSVTDKNEIKKLFASEDLGKILNLKGEEIRKSDAMEALNGATNPRAYLVELEGKTNMIFIPRAPMLIKVKVRAHSRKGIIKSIYLSKIDKTFHFYYANFVKNQQDQEKPTAVIIDQGDTTTDNQIDENRFVTDPRPFEYLPFSYVTDQEDKEVIYFPRLDITWYEFYFGYTGRSSSTGTIILEAGRPRRNQDGLTEDSFSQLEQYNQSLIYARSNWNQEAQELLKTKGLEAAIKGLGLFKIPIKRFQVENQNGSRIFVNQKGDVLKSEEVLAYFKKDEPLIIGYGLLEGSFVILPSPDAAMLTDEDIVKTSRFADQLEEIFGKDWPSKDALNVAVEKLREYYADNHFEEKIGPLDYWIAAEAMPYIKDTGQLFKRAMHILDIKDNLWILFYALNGISTHLYEKKAHMPEYLTIDGESTYGYIDLELIYRFFPVFLEKFIAADKNHQLDYFLEEKHAGTYERVPARMLFLLTLANVFLPGQWEFAHRQEALFYWKRFVNVLRQNEVNQTIELLREVLGAGLSKRYGLNFTSSMQMDSVLSRDNIRELPVSTRTVLKSSQALEIWIKTFLNDFPEKARTGRFKNLALNLFDVSRVIPNEEQKDWPQQARIQKMISDLQSYPTPDAAMMALNPPRRNPLNVIPIDIEKDLSYITGYPGGVVLLLLQPLLKKYKVQIMEHTVSRLKKFIKSNVAFTDEFVFDLSDPIDPKLKPLAREILLELLKDKETLFGDRRVTIRVNDGGKELQNDLDNVIGVLPEAIDNVFIAVKNAADVIDIEKRLFEITKRHNLPQDKIKLMLFLSSKESYANVDKIALISDLTTALVLSHTVAGDFNILRSFYKSLWGDEDEGREAEALRYQRSKAFLAIDGANKLRKSDQPKIKLIDHVINADMSNEEKLRMVARKALNRGASGIRALTPLQARVYAEIFSQQPETTYEQQLSRARQDVQESEENGWDVPPGFSEYVPTPEEIDLYISILEKFQQAQLQGKGGFLFGEKGKEKLIDAYSAHRFMHAIQRGKLTQEQKRHFGRLEGLFGDNWKDQRLIYVPQSNVETKAWATLKKMILHSKHQIDDDVRSLANVGANEVSQVNEKISKEKQKLEEIRYLLLQMPSNLVEKHIDEINAAIGSIKYVDFVIDQDIDEALKRNVFTEEELKYINSGQTPEKDYFLRLTAHLAAKHAVYTAILDHPLLDYIDKHTLRTKYSREELLRHIEIEHHPQSGIPSVNLSGPLENIIPKNFRLHISMARAQGLGVGIAAMEEIDDQIGWGVDYSTTKGMVDILLENRNVLKDDFNEKEIEDVLRKYSDLKQQAFEFTKRLAFKDAAKKALGDLSLDRKDFEKIVFSITHKDMVIAEAAGQYSLSIENFPELPEIIFRVLQNTSEEKGSVYVTAKAIKNEKPSVASEDKQKPTPQAILKGIKDAKKAMDEKVDNPQMGIERLREINEKIEDALKVPLEAYRLRMFDLTKTDDLKLHDEIVRLRMQSHYMAGMLRDLEKTLAPFHSFPEFLKHYSQLHPNQKFLYLSGFKENNPIEAEVKVQSLWLDVNRLANYLYDHNVEKGDPVFVMMSTTVQKFVSVMAALKIGAIKVNRDQGLPLDKTLDGFKRAGGRVIIFDDATRKELEEIAKTEEGAEFFKTIKVLIQTNVDDVLPGHLQTKRELGEIAGIKVVDYREALAQGSIDDPITRNHLKIDPNDTAIYQFTSGTTKAPKILLHSHRRWMEAALGTAQFFPDDNETEVGLTFLNTDHVYGVNSAFFTPIITGTDSILLPKHRDHRSKEYRGNVIKLIKLKRIRRLYSVPNALEGIFTDLLKDYLTEDQIKEVKKGKSIKDINEADELIGILESIHLVVVRGAPFTKELAKFLIDGLGLSVANGYGASEAIQSTQQVPGNIVRDTIGLPIPNIKAVRLRGKDTDGKYSVNGPILYTLGSEGLLGISPGSLGQYLGDQEATKAAKDEFGTVYPGDVVSVGLDGYISFKDREGDIWVDANGNNISPGVIEEAILEIDGVAMVAAFPRVRDGKKVPAVMIQMRENATPPTIAQVVEHARQKLDPPHRPHPNEIYFGKVLLSENEVKPNRKATAASVDNALLSVGQTFVGPKVTVTKQLIRYYSLATGDRHSLHLDPEYMAKTRYGTVIMHGPFTESYTLSALMEEKALEEYSLVGSEVKFTVAVKPGDTINPESVIDFISDDQQEIQVTTKAVNQRGETIFISKVTLRKGVKEQDELNNEELSEEELNELVKDLQPVEPKAGRSYAVGERLDVEGIKLTKSMYLAYKYLLSHKNMNAQFKGKDLLLAKGLLALASARAGQGYVHLENKIEKVLRPIHIGDEFYFKAQITDVIEKPKTGQDIIIFSVNAFNQNDELVFEATVKKMRQKLDQGPSSGSVQEQRIVEAFGGDKESAFKEIDRKLEALRTINPSATREQALERLDWEYKTREAENVFPAINWKFMLAAAQAGMDAPINVLDFEDAVSPSLKDKARTVAVILIKAFKGESISVGELYHLEVNAVDVNEAKIDGIKRPLKDFFDQTEKGFQLKQEYRFHPDQMIFLRLNNLRTMWAARDFAETFRSTARFIDGIYLPKAESAEDVRLAVRIIRAIQKEQGLTPGGHKVNVLLESASALLKAKEILAVAPEVEEVQFGTVDYSADTGAKTSLQHEPLKYLRFAYPWLGKITRDFGKIFGPGVTANFSQQKTSEETGKLIAMGWINRKWAINPGGLKGINEHKNRFPKIVRKFMTYEDLQDFDLKELDQKANNNEPILAVQQLSPKDFRPVRVVVEVDANKQEQIQNALGSLADMIIFDVSETTDLLNLSQTLEQNKKTSLKLIKINPTISEESLEKLVKELGKTMDGFMVVDVKQADQIRALDLTLSKLEKRFELNKTLKIAISFTESQTIEDQARAIVDNPTNVILQASGHRINWAFLDIPALAKEEETDSDTKGYNYWHSLFMALTAQAGIEAIDGYSLDEDLEKDAESVAVWGFEGKRVKLETSQINTVVKIMTPQKADSFLNSIELNGVVKEELLNLLQGESKGESLSPEARAWLREEKGKEFLSVWRTSVERDLQIIHLYAQADNERKQGAVSYFDPFALEAGAEMVDAASARIPLKQLQKARAIGSLTNQESMQYETDKQKLSLALKPDLAMSAEKDVEGYLRQQGNPQAAVDKFIRMIKEGNVLFEMGAGNTKIASQIAQNNPVNVVAIDLFSTQGEDAKYIEYGRLFEAGQLEAQKINRSNVVALRASWHDLVKLLPEASINQILVVNGTIKLEEELISALGTSDFKRRLKTGWRVILKPFMPPDWLETKYGIKFKRAENKTIFGVDLDQASDYKNQNPEVAIIDEETLNSFGSLRVQPGFRRELTKRWKPDDSAMMANPTMMTYDRLNPAGQKLVDEFISHIEMGIRNGVYKLKDPNFKVERNDVSDFLQTVGQKLVEWKDEDPADIPIKFEKFFNDRWAHWYDQLAGIAAFQKGNFGFQSALDMIVYASLPKDHPGIKTWEAIYFSRERALAHLEYARFKKTTHFYEEDLLSFNQLNDTGKKLVERLVALGNMDQTQATRFLQIVGQKIISLQFPGSRPLRIFMRHYVTKPEWFDDLMSVAKSFGENFTPRDIFDVIVYGSLNQHLTEDVDKNIPDGRLAKALTKRGLVRYYQPDRAMTAETPRTNLTAILADLTYISDDAGDEVDKRFKALRALRDGKFSPDEYRAIIHELVKVIMQTWSSTWKGHFINLLRAVYKNSQMSDLDDLIKQSLYSVYKNDSSFSIKKQAYDGLAEIDSRFGKIWDLNLLINARLPTSDDIYGRKIIKDIPDERIYVANRDSVGMGLASTVISELIHNAEKYTPENGTITVKLRRENSDIVFSVVNTGPGISQEDLPRIWKRGFRTMQGQEMAMGTGLGMANVKELVEDYYRGSISVTSVINGETIFTVRIPVGNIDKNFIREMDIAMLSKNPGGIDLNANQEKLKESGDRIKFSIPTEDSQWRNLNIDGFVPVIINIAPSIRLPELMGMIDDHQKEINVSSLN